jgi:hypothetical protein
VAPELRLIPKEKMSYRERLYEGQRLQVECSLVAEEAAGAE